MNELTKIKDVSSRYGITARTLRYYEDMGLIFFFIGIGMIIQFMMPTWGFLIAAALIVLGFWYVFAR